MDEDSIHDVNYFSRELLAEKATTNKNYISLFTCLTMRAIHLEITNNLTAENSLTAIRRFIALRGSPKLIISDNATYFVAAHRQIMKQPLNINRNEIATSAPQFGGVWERLVSIIKRVLLLNLRSDRLSRDLS